VNPDAAASEAALSAMVTSEAVVNSGGWDTRVLSLSDGSLGTG
jgi:hypothetical protein